MKATLDRVAQSLIDAARLARSRAYAPYSGFQVGAAVWTSSDETFLGCNVENSSYGLTTCAERNAVAAAVAGTAGGPPKILAIAIVGPDGQLFPPCGACRQVLSEFAMDDMRVLFQSSRGMVDVHLSELLPYAFNLQSGVSRSDGNG